MTYHGCCLRQGLVPGQFGDSTGLIRLNTGTASTPATADDVQQKLCLLSRRTERYSPCTGNAGDEDQPHPAPRLITVGLLHLGQHTPSFQRRRLMVS
ncbi:MAG TPA: hypothetical protein V6D09_00295 [Leptolyngbyaceae cyanobacterium]